MVNLAQHIEKLLAENECVIIPHFGGFITYYAPARWSEKEDVFFPPTRMTRFNPKLTINDGLLAQSYMETYGVNFAEASHMIQSEVIQWISDLHSNGTVDLPHIGKLQLSLHNTFIFTPCTQQIPSSEWFGLSSFRISKLTIPYSPTKAISSPLQRKEDFSQKFRIRFNTSLWSNVAAVAAIIILFFAISIPVQNTETVNGNYAQLLPTEVFKQMGKQSLAITPMLSSSMQKMVQEEEKIISQRSDTLPSATTHITEAVTVSQPKKEITKTPHSPRQQTQSQTATSSPRIYHIIVASVGSKADAEKMAADLMRKGNADAQAIIGDGKMRVSICSYADEMEAYQAIKQLRKKETYQNAWVLKKKITRK